MTNLLCCRQHFKICSMQWEPNETWCHKKIYFPSNAIEVMKDLFCLVFWVTAHYDLWSPAELTLIGTGCQLTTGSITSIDPMKGYERTCVLKNPDGSRFACVTEGKNPSRSCRFASERFRCTEQKSSRDSSWSVTNPNQIIPAPSCREMNEWLEGKMTNTRKSNVKFNQEKLKSLVKDSRYWLFLLAALEQRLT